MKQILITIMMLAIALALVIGVVVPIFKHGASTGDNAILKGQSTMTRIGQVLR
ncbi:MAG TPA: hypothetical protein VIK78_18535 [Ruminiclostridium sp.]